MGGARPPSLPSRRCRKNRTRGSPA